MEEIQANQILSVFADVYPGLLAYMDKNLINRFVNKSYEDWIGKTREEIVGRHVRDIVGEEFFVKRLPNIQRVLNGEELKFRTVLSHSKLGERYVEQIYRPDFDNNGSVRGFFVIVYDINDQISELNEAQQSEKLFKNYLEMIPHLAFIADSKGVITYFNQRWYEFTGVSTELNLNEISKYFIHPEDIEETRKRWEHCFANGLTFEIEYRLKRKDGHYRWQLCRCVGIKDTVGEITYWIGTNTDIHEQKEIEIKHQQLITILESSSDIIGLSNTDGELLYLNRAARETFKIDEDYAGKKIDEFIHQDDLKYFNTDILAPLIEKGKIEGDIRVKKMNSSDHIKVNFSGFLTTSDKTGEVTGLATISRDITEIKNKEKKLEEALHSRDQFLSMASHELKTPLTSLKLQSELTLRQLNANKNISQERQFIVAHQTNQLVGRLTRLIDDMLDVSRIKTGKLKIDKSEYDIGNIVREVVFRMCSLFEAGGLLVPKVFIEEKICGHWDRFRLEQVIGNLLTNAIKYGRGNPIEIRVIKKGCHVQISVKDNGYGIAREDLQRIFDRFERAIHYNEVSGMGLGLFISKEIVEAHGGEIWVESEETKGSTFYVSIPL